MVISPCPHVHPVHMQNMARLRQRQRERERGQDAERERARAKERERARERERPGDDRRHPARPPPRRRPLRQPGCPRRLGVYPLLARWRQTYGLNPTGETRVGAEAVLQNFENLKNSPVDVEATNLMQVTSIRPLAKHLTISQSYAKSLTILRAHHHLTVPSVCLRPLAVSESSAALR